MEDGNEQDWCPPAPATQRDLLPDPLPVVMAVDWEVEMHGEKKSKADNVKHAIGEKELKISKEAKVSEHFENIVTVKVKKVKKAIVGVLDHVGYRNEVECDKPSFTEQSNLAGSYLSAGKKPVKYVQLVKPEKHAKAVSPLKLGKPISSVKIGKPVRKPGLGCRY